MKIIYPTQAITRLRAQATKLGHDLDGRWKKSGLSFGLTCTTCRRDYVLITPAWFPWEHDKITGGALRLPCPGKPADVHHATKGA